MSANPNAAPVAPAPAKSKKLIVIVAIVAVLAIVAAAAYVLMMQRQHSSADGEEEGLEAFGIKLNKEENGTRKPGARIISTPDSKIPVIIIPTNEELQIALATVEVLKK